MFGIYCPNISVVYGQLIVIPLSISINHWVITENIYEPTRAHCTVGSYMPLSVCLPVGLSVTLDNNSYLKKYEIKGLK